MTLCVDRSAASRTDFTPPSYQRIRAAWVDWARGRPGEFEKRLKNLVETYAKGKQFGYGIEDFF